MKTPTALIMRRGRLKFVGSLSFKKNLEAKDWKIEVPCWACGRYHHLSLDMLSSVKAVNGQTVRYTCPNNGLDAGFTLSARDLRTAHKYLRRSQNPDWLNREIADMKTQLTKLKKLKPQSRRINPMPGMSGPIKRY